MTLAIQVLLVAVAIVSIGILAGGHLKKGLSGTLDGVRFVDDGSPLGRPVPEWWVLIPDSVIATALVLSLPLLRVGAKGARTRRTRIAQRVTA